MSRFIFIAYCFSIAVISSAQERTWTDATGRFKVKAKLVDVQEGTAFLQRSDIDRTMTIPIAKLSEVDRKVIERFREDMAKSLVEPEQNYEKSQRTAKESLDPLDKPLKDIDTKKSVLLNTESIKEKLKAVKQRLEQLAAEIDALRAENAQLMEALAKSDYNGTRIKWLKHGKGRITKLKDGIVFRDTIGQLEVIIHEVQTGGCPFHC